MPGQISKRVKKERIARERYTNLPPEELAWVLGLGHFDLRFNRAAIITLSGSITSRDLRHLFSMEFFHCTRLLWCDFSRTRAKDAGLE
jgi:hypothetical protein